MIDPGGYSKKFGYGCAAGNFDYHPIAKPQMNQICNPYSNQFSVLPSDQ